MKKNILIISELFPPINRVGAYRSAFFSKYLKRFGWNVHVLTCDTNQFLSDIGNCSDFDGLPPAQNITHINVSGKDYTTLTHFERLIYSLIQPQNKHYKEFIEKFKQSLNNIILNNDINIVYASSGPIATLTVGNFAYEKFKIPWVADFRDILEQFEYSSTLGKIYSRNLIQYENKILRSASKIITVSSPLKAVLENRKNGKEVMVIENGFDNELHERISREVFFPKFSILYSGAIWDKNHRRPHNLFKAIELGLSHDCFNESDLEINFLGTEPDIIKDLIHILPFKKCIHVLPKTGYIKSLELQHKSCILLHLSHERQKGIFTSKLFDYLGSQRPILSVPGDHNCVDELLRITNAGVSADSPEAILHQLTLWYDEWRKTGNVKFQGKESEIQCYTRESQAKKLEKTLIQIIESQ